MENGVGSGGGMVMNGWRITVTIGLRTPPSPLFLPHGRNKSRTVTPSVAVCLQRLLTGCITRHTPAWRDRQPLTGSRTRWNLIVSCRLGVQRTRKRPTTIFVVLQIIYREKAPLWKGNKWLSSAWLEHTLRLWRVSVLQAMGRDTEFWRRWQRRFTVVTWLIIKETEMFRDVFIISQTTILNITSSWLTLQWP